MGTGILRWGVHALRPAAALVELRDRGGRLEREKEPFGRVDIVVFEIKALQPGVLPIEALVFAEGLKQPLLGNPIYRADQAGGVVAQGIQSKGPDIEHPIRLGIAPARVLLRVRKECLLDLQGRARVTILELRGPLPGALVRNLPCGDHSIAENDIIRQVAFFQQ